MLVRTHRIGLAEERWPGSLHEALEVDAESECLRRQGTQPRTAVPHDAHSRRHTMHNGRGRLCRGFFSAEPRGRQLCANGRTISAFLKSKENLDRGGLYGAEHRSRLSAASF